MSEYFIFGDVDTRNYGVTVFESSTFGAPQRDSNSAAVPGRNGDLILDGKRYPNTTHSYDCVIYDGFYERLQNIRNALASKQGYFRLTDSIHADEFYMAQFKQEFVVSMNADRDIGRFNVEFMRKPQRFLTSGELVTELTVTGSITNPTLFDSKPFLRVYGAGVLGVADCDITISAADSYTDIDCDMMEAYKGTVSCNDLISLSTNDFPVLHPGANGIRLGTGITRVQITPRWYRL